MDLLQIIQANQRLKLYHQENFKKSDNSQSVKKMAAFMQAIKGNYFHLFTVLQITLLEKIINIPPL